MMKLNYKMGLADLVEGASILVNNIKDTKGKSRYPKGGVERTSIDLSQNHRKLLEFDLT